MKNENGDYICTDMNHQTNEFYKCKYFKTCKRMRFDDPSIHNPNIPCQMKLIEKNKQERLVKQEVKREVKYKKLKKVKKTKNKKLKDFI